MTRNILIIFCVLAFFLSSTAQTAWKLEKDNNGIKVYSSDSGSLKFRSVKVVCELEGSLDRLQQILWDVANHKHWVYSTTESSLLKTINENELLYYAVLDFSILTSKRDVVIRMTSHLDSVLHTMEVFTDGEPAGLPEKKGLVRIPVFHARYEVSEAGANRISIVYYSMADPGGSVSAWITNMFVAKGPYNTFMSLAALLRHS